MQFRTTFVLLIGFILVTALAPAQQRMGDRGGRDEEQVKRMKEKIGLTDDQAAKVKEILKKAREEARAAFEQNNSDRDTRRNAMLKRVEKSDAEIMTLLTKEQKIKFEDFKKERQKEMQERRRDR